MSELNRDEIISEIDIKIKYAKFINTDAVILSSKAAQFCLEHAQFYEQKIKELTEENEAISKRYAIQVVTAIELDKQVKRLTEENERLEQRNKILEAKNERLENICNSYALQYGTVADKEVFLKEERADTVRKMQELIKERCIKGGIYPAFVARVIEQVAKEMMEEEK